MLINFLMQPNTAISEHKWNGPQILLAQVCNFVFSYMLSIITPWLALGSIAVFCTIGWIFLVGSIALGGTASCSAGFDSRLCIGAWL